MKNLTPIATAIALSLSAIAPVTQAVQLADGTIYFNHPPRLMSAITTRDTANAWNAKYYFTLTVPENAGEPLQDIAIAQHDGIDDIRFNLDKTEAFAGTYRDKQSPFNISQVTQNEETNAVSVRLDPPVPPGTTVTIALHALRNPRSSGIYQFGVTAFPAGDKIYGQFLGFGRLHFYRNGNGFFWDF